MFPPYSPVSLKSLEKLMETKAKHMTHFSKTLFAAAIIGAIAGPALAQIAPPEASPQCAPIEMSVYFPAEQAALTEAAQVALAAQADQNDACKVSTIEARAISTDGGDALSQARSSAVLSALADMGIATADTDVKLAQAEAPGLITTARRVDIILTSLPALSDS